MLGRIRDELVKVDRLARYEVLKREILWPTLEWSRRRGDIDADEEKLLWMAADKGQFKAVDVQAAIPEWTVRQRTYRLGKLVDSGLVQAVGANKRTYCIQFARGVLIRGVTRMLVQKGFAPNFG